jgi:hypothetical protein
MSSKGFVVAMRGHIANLSYDRPFEHAHGGQEDGASPDWLIVSRWGPGAGYLTISSATRTIRHFGPVAISAATAVAVSDADGQPERFPGSDPAPMWLQPRQTWFGLLVPDDMERGESVFLLDHSLPRGVVVAGRFIPAEGYARLRLGEDGALRLVAVARAASGPVAAFAELPAPGRTSEVIRFPGIPARALSVVQPIPPAAQAWMVRAERRPWVGECVDAPG